MHLRFFLSSPGDVADERIFAQQVIEQELPKDPLLRGEITCEAIRWDDPAAPVSMPASLSLQEAVNRGLPKPSECDVVIVILWSRLGTPLPPNIVRPNGSPYLSGTEWSMRTPSMRSRHHIRCSIAAKGSPTSVTPMTSLPTTSASPNIAASENSSSAFAIRTDR